MSLLNISDKVLLIAHAEVDVGAPLLTQGRRLRFAVYLRAVRFMLELVYRRPLRRVRITDYSDVFVPFALASRPINVA